MDSNVINAILFGVAAGVLLLVIIVLIYLLIVTRSKDGEKKKNNGQRKQHDNPLTVIEMDYSVTLEDIESISAVTIDNAILSQQDDGSVQQTQH
jgi:heme/copper-type cytochrome/quinol oxidase subunit 2